MNNNSNTPWITLRLKAPVGTSDTTDAVIQIPIQNHTAVREIKKTIEESASIESENQKLVYMGTILDSDSLEYHEWMKNSEWRTVHLVPSRPQALERFRTCLGNNKESSSEEQQNGDIIEVRAIQLTFSHRIEKSETVGQLYMAVHLKTGWFLSEMLLICNGIGLRHWHWDFHLSDFLVMDKSIVYVVVETRNPSASKRSSDWVDGPQRRRILRLLRPMVSTSGKAIISSQLVPLILAQSQVHSVVPSLASIVMKKMVEV